jgi:hypothetical protein
MEHDYRRAGNFARGRWAWPLLVALVAVLFTPQSGGAHGVVGNRIFLSPIIGNDAFPDNALNLTARGSNYQFTLVPELEKQLSDNSSLLLTGSWTRINQRRAQGASAGDLNLWFRQSVYVSARHELEITLSPLVILPVGARGLPDQGYTHLGGEFLLGKGLGDLPDPAFFAYLRPLALQVEIAYAGRVQGPANSDVFDNLEMEYSLRYLDRFVGRTDLNSVLLDVTPFVQFNYAQSFFTSDLTTKPDFRLTPGLAYQTNFWQVSLAAQIALNRTAQPGDGLAALGLVEIYYDEIFPALGWKPF